MPPSARFISRGMSEAEVIMQIGRPDVQTKGQGKRAAGDGPICLPLATRTR